MTRIVLVVIASVLVLGNVSPVVGVKLRAYVKAGDKTQILKLMQAHQITANTIINNRQENLLHILATVVAGRDDQEFWGKLIDENTSLDEVNEEGVTPVHLAAINRNFWLMQFLLISGAKATLENNLGKTATDYLHSKIDRDMYDMLQMYSNVEKLLTDEGAAIDQTITRKRHHGDSLPFTGGDSADNNATFTSKPATKPTTPRTSSDRILDPVETPPFLVNLNERARAGEIDTVVGRAEEIRQLAEVLGRRQKNNPIMVGDAGVGKTAIVEGLAELIVRGEVS